MVSYSGLIDAARWGGAGRPRTACCCTTVHSSVHATMPPIAGMSVIAPAPDLAIAGISTQPTPRMAMARPLQARAGQLWAAGALRRDDARFAHDAAAAEGGGIIAVRGVGGGVG